VADVRDLIPQAERVEQQIYGLWYAIIATTIPQPATVAKLQQPIYLTVPDIDPNSLWGPCYWMPRVIPEQVDVSEPPDSHGDAEPSHIITIPKIIMPTKGDAALMAFDNRKNNWVVSWWPT
jgi:hypothetical protein